MSVTERAAERRLLSFEEVAAASQPATFSAFGDHLLYLDGTVYALPRAPQPSELLDPLRLPGAYVVTQTVGIELGWQHPNGCMCTLRISVPEWEAA
jgi:hypothetical protein